MAIRSEWDNMDSSVAYLYLITSFRTKKKYIGITNNPYARWEAHKQAARDGEDKPLYRAMKAYGVNSFNFAVLATGPRWAIANMEAALIRYWKTKHPKGYNLADGGENTQ
jgi:predicted GIY-YIG superfamily endonuclease